MTAKQIKAPRRLAEAMMANSPPCELFSCPKRSVCAEGMHDSETLERVDIACFSFYQYVVRNRKLDPRMTGTGAKKRTLGEIVPTAHWYRRAMEESSPADQLRPPHVRRRKKVYKRHKNIGKAMVL